MSSARERDGGIPPVCVHGHKISLPLLGDFPKRRKDVNPFREDAVFEGLWGSFTLRGLDSHRGSQPILVFLDSHTIHNVRILDAHTYEGDVYLFVGDTQHGPADGFLSLIELSHQRCVKKIFFVNNPQHAHWFARTPADFSRFAFLPIGLANHEKSDTWEARHVQESVVHIGNVLPGHAYRKHILEGLQEQGARVTFMRTAGYRTANSVYSAARGALNISLNSDLSFRLSEVLVSGGLCISDELGFVQRENFAYALSDSLLTFGSLAELLTILSDVESGEVGRRSTLDPFDGERLETLDDVATFARAVVEPRIGSWSSPGGGRMSDLDRYLSVRDTCIREVQPMVEVDIACTADLDFFLDLLDLPRLKIMARCSPSLIRVVEYMIDRFDVRKRTWIRKLATS